MGNYRFNIRNKLFDIAYPKEFHKMREFIPQVLEIIAKLKEEGAVRAWYFFEPFIEITWVADEKDAETIHKTGLDLITKLFPGSEVEYLTPSNGNFQDWYCIGQSEYEFGAERHAHCCEWVKSYIKYKDGVDNGKGVERQVARTIHTLCNPLGLSYIEEGKICFSRGLFCLLARWFPFKVARWIYKYIFFQKY